METAVERVVILYLSRDSRTREWFSVSWASELLYDVGMQSATFIKFSRGYL